MILPSRSARTILALAVVLAAFAAVARADSKRTADGVPHLDHIIVVVLENQNYEVTRVQPWTASWLAGGASFSQSFGITHPSQPNYIALWSGDLQGITTNTCLPAGTYLTAENLGHACEAAGLRWRAYSEDLPEAGSAVCAWNSNLYTRKHEPWTSFGNLDHMNERPYSDLAIDIANDSLPNLVFVIPNNRNNGHDTNAAYADAWCSNNLPAMVEAVEGRGIVILTWDEDDFAGNNHILTVFHGLLVMPGMISSQTITHYTVLRTICDALGLAPFGNAVGATPITDIWQSDSVLAVPPMVSPSELELSNPSPNPSHGTTWARLSLPSETAIRAEIFDATGRRVREIVSGVRRGEVMLVWDGRDEFGRASRAGLYFLRVNAGGEQLERRFARVR